MPAKKTEASDGMYRRVGISASTRGKKATQEALDKAKDDPAARKAILARWKEEQQALKSVFERATESAGYQQHLQEAEAAARAILEDPESHAVRVKLAEDVLAWAELLGKARERGDAEVAEIAAFYLGGAAERLGVNAYAPAVREGEATVARRRKGAAKQREKWEKHHAEWQRMADALWKDDPHGSKHWAAIQIERQLRERDGDSPSVQRIERTIKKTGEQENM
jgi:hypothetical protein